MQQLPIDRSFALYGSEKSCSDAAATADSLYLLGGKLCHRLDAATGAHLWKHETNDAIWGCIMLAGDRLYVGNAEGLMTVLRTGRRKEVLAQIEMDAPLYTRPAVVGDSLYLATARRLYLIAAKP